MMSLPLYPPFILGILEERLSPKLGGFSDRGAFITSHCSRQM